jgi:hypothetical protein
VRPRVFRKDKKKCLQKSKNIVEVQEVKNEVKMEVKPVSGLEVMRMRRTIPQGPRTIVHEQSELTPASVSELTSPLAPYLTPSYSFNTELCVDLKTILISDRRAKMRKNYTGVLTRDGKQHYTFMESAPEKKVRRRYPCVYQGGCINVHKRDDGTLYPTFRQPGYTRFYTFKDFCREAAEELLFVAGFIEEE